MADARSPAGSNRSLRSPRSQPSTRTSQGASQIHNLVNTLMPRQESKRATGGSNTPASGSCTPTRSPAGASEIRNLINRLMPRQESKRATGGSNTPASGSCTPGAYTRSPAGSAHKGVGDLDFTFKPEDEVWRLNSAETEAAEIQAQEMKHIQNLLHLERQALEEAADVEALKMRQIKQLRQQILERDAEEEAAALEALNAAPLKVRECFYGRREGSASVSASASPRIVPETYTLKDSASPRISQETRTLAGQQTLQVPPCEPIADGGYSKNEASQCGPHDGCTTEPSGLAGLPDSSPFVFTSLNETVDVTESAADPKGSAESSELVKQSCISEPDLAELVIAAAREHGAVNIESGIESSNNTPLHMCHVPAPEFDGSGLSNLHIQTKHQPPQIQNTDNMDALAELETGTLRGREASALMEMGFRQHDAEDILQQTSLSTEEAANHLLDKESPPESAWDMISKFLVNEIFGICSLRSTRLDTYRPGTYTVLEIPDIPAAIESSYSNVSMMATDVRETCSEALGERIEVGSVVDIVETQVSHAQQVIRGRTKGGRWVCIASASPDGEVWAKPVPLAQQLIELGFTERQANEAAKRSSNVNGALEFLASRE